MFLGLRGAEKPAQAYPPSPALVQLSQKGRLFAVTVHVWNGCGHVFFIFMRVRVCLGLPRQPFRGFCRSTAKLDLCTRWSHSVFLPLIVLQPRVGDTCCLCREILRGYGSWKSLCSFYCYWYYSTSIRYHRRWIPRRSLVLPCVDARSSVENSHIFLLFLHCLSCRGGHAGVCRAKISSPAVLSHPFHGCGRRRVFSQN